MKKYLQIIVVLGIFAALVLVRQIKGGDQPIIVGNQNNNLVPSQSNSAQVQTSQSPTPTVSESALTNSSLSQTLAPTAQVQQGIYKNGTYDGSVEDAFYGLLQVQAVITNGKISDVIFLQFPNDNRTSQYINSQADPMLKQEAIQAQSAQVDTVSGASASSGAFKTSLANALAKAR
jgi:uncharacterized protein with FMN-binding domain